MTNNFDRLFVRDFDRRATLAERLHCEGHRGDACIIATSALDALGELWLRDLPQEAEALGRELGGAVPSSLRMARLVKRFAPNTEGAGRVAVMMLAEDWLDHGAAGGDHARALLQARQVPARSLPPSHLDLSLPELECELPVLKTSEALRRLAEEYEYPALVYRFWRCAEVHTGERSARTHGFAEGTESMYFSGSDGRHCLGVGLGMITAWVRVVAESYAEELARAGVRPGGKLRIETGDALLRTKWERLAF